MLASPTFEQLIEDAAWRTGQDVWVDTVRDRAIELAGPELRLLEARLDRAVTHWKAFKAMWDEYLAERPHTNEIVYGDDGLVEIQMYREDPIPAELSVILGEFLYEMRAALDNCLYAVAVIVCGQNPPPGANKLEWPIRSTSDEWKSHLHRYRGLPKEIVDALEKIQPYQAELPAWNSLANLHDLARFDRHRTARSLGLYIVDIRIWFNKQNVQLLHVAKECIVRSGDVLVRMKLTPGFSLAPENFDMYVEFEVDVDDVKSEVGPRGSEGRPWGPLDNRLRAIHKAVTEYTEGLLALAVDLALEGADAKAGPV